MHQNSRKTQNYQTEMLAFFSLGNFPEKICNSLKYDSVKILHFGWAKLDYDLIAKLKKKTSPPTQKFRVAKLLKFSNVE